MTLRGEAWDMIAGRAEPELGGGERYLDAAAMPDGRLVVVGGSIFMGDIDAQVTVFTIE